MQKKIPFRKISFEFTSPEELTKNNLDAKKLNERMLQIKQTEICNAIFDRIKECSKEGTDRISFDSKEFFKMAEPDQYDFNWEPIFIALIQKYGPYCIKEIHSTVRRNPLIVSSGIETLTHWEFIYYLENAKANLLSFEQRRKRNDIFETIKRAQCSHADVIFRIRETVNEITVNEVQQCFEVYSLYFSRGECDVKTGERAFDLSIEKWKIPKFDWSRFRLL